MGSTELAIRYTIITIGKVGVRIPAWTRIKNGSMIPRLAIIPTEKMYCVWPVLMKILRRMTPIPYPMKPMISPEYAAT